ncbi:MAG TPA: hypothetical protein VK395_01170 [Gemmataceae bacterium]|nr:hypothetical protein [Gemmataceae bacterium]
MARFGKISYVLWLAFAYCGFFDTEVSYAQVPADLAWHKVQPSARSQILELLSVQTRANYERIETLQASYSVHHEDYLSRDFVKEAFGARLPKDSSPALIREIEVNQKVAIDMESGRVFRERETKRFRLLTTTSRKPVIMPGVGDADDGRSIVTSEDYTFFNPKQPPATSVVAGDNPKAQNKRMAHRLAPEKARGREYSGLLDPRTFYRCASNQKSWEELQMYLSTLKGEKGADQQQKVQKLEIDEAEQAGSIWYRLRLPITSPDGKFTTWTSVWSPLAGYNPVSLIFSKGENAGGPITKSISWEWKQVDGIFFPAVIHEVWHPDGLPDNVDTLNEVITLKECSLNSPLPSNQFSYGALGLKTGDLILDDMESTVFIVNDAGIPVRLAGYNEEYVAPALARRTKFGWLLAVNAAGIAIALLVVVLIRRRRRKSIPT